MTWLPDDITLTNNTGAHGAKAEESCLMALLMLQSRMPELILNQRNRVWDCICTTPIAGTAVIGNVFASEPGVGTNSTNFINRPLGGVTITVDGMEESLPKAAWRAEALRRVLLDHYRAARYELILPPFLEHLDSLLTGVGADMDSVTFKLTDPASGRLLGLRSDMTPQAARIAARHFADQAVVRLCYLGTVLRTRPDALGGAPADVLGSAVAVVPARAWQLLYFRSGQWVPAQALLGSARAAPGASADAASLSFGETPEGLRLILEMPEGAALPGRLVSDWFSPLPGAAR